MSTGIGTGLRTTVIIVSLGAGFAAAIATVIAFFGSAFWLFDWFANFRWQLMWFSILCAIAYALTSKGLLTLVFIGSALVNGWLLVPLWWGNQPVGTGEDGTSVVAVDMYGGSDDAESTLKWLFDTDADVIIAAGVGTERLEALIVEGSAYRFLYRPAEGDAGIAVVAKDDYTTAEASTPNLGDPVLTVTVPSGTGSIDIVTSWGPLATNGDRFDALVERIETISEVVAASPNETMVIGSLGATRFTEGMRTLMAEAGLRDATEGKGYLSTWPVSGFPFLGGWFGAPVDVVLMSAGITPFALETGPDIGVNHLPLRVTVGDTVRRG